MIDFSIRKVGSVAFKELRRSRRREYLRGVRELGRRDKRVKRGRLKGTIHGTGRTKKMGKKK